LRTESGTELLELPNRDPPENPDELEPEAPEPKLLLRTKDGALL
jgi:hypothetical protein